MTSRLPTDRRMLLPAGLAMIVLAAVSTVAIAATNGAFGHRNRAVTTCSAPSLVGAVVDVSLIDMRGMGDMMSDGQSGWRAWRPGMMRVIANRQSVAPAAVSFVVANAGVIRHELVVLPLTGTQAVGSRAVGTDGTVDETGSITEASADCVAGKGDGITSGSTGWTTATLPPGRYELICNLPGHYTAGMHTELDVT